jgi:hypothetical protein
MLFVILVIHVNNQTIKGTYYRHLTNLHNDFKVKKVQKFSRMADISKEKKL